MTPEQAYNELKDLYRVVNHCSPGSPTVVLSWAKSPELSATYLIRLYGWHYRRTEIMVNRCRELAPLALQYQP